MNLRLHSISITKLRFKIYISVIILCAWSASSVWLSRSNHDLRATYDFLKQHGLFTLKSPIERLESFEGAASALTVATRLHGEYFNSTDNSTPLVVTSLPFDRFIPNSLNLQWATASTPPFGLTDFRNLPVFLSALKHDKRPIGQYLNERISRRNSDEPDSMVIKRLNQILIHDKLSRPNIINKLSLDEGTMALVNYPNPYFSVAYLNRRIIEQAFPEYFFHDLIKERDIINWQKLVDAIQSEKNLITNLVQNSLLESSQISTQDLSSPSAPVRQLILFTMNRLIQANALLVPLESSTSLFLREETLEAIKEKKYGRNLIRLNRMLIEDGFPNIIRRGGAPTDKSFDLYPYYPSVAIGVDLGDYTLIQKNSFFGSVITGDGIWFRPAKHIFTDLPIEENWSIPFSEDLARSKEVLIWVTGPFSDNLDFGSLVFQTDVLTDDSWLVSNTHFVGWNDKQFIENEHWLPSSVKGNYGEIYMKFPSLPSSRAKWIGRNPMQKESTNTYYRKTVKLETPMAGTLTISGINRYQLFINGQLIGNGDHWPIPQKYNVTLKDGDVIGVQLSVDDKLNDALLLDFSGTALNGWSKDRVQAGHVGNTTFLKKELKESDISQARRTGNLDVSDLAQYQRPGMKFSYYVSPFRKH